MCKEVSILVIDLIGARILIVNWISKGGNKFKPETRNLIPDIISRRIRPELFKSSILSGSDKG